MAKMICKQCGKREAEFMSKLEIKNRFSPSTIEKIFDVAVDMLSPKYIYCGACGYTEKA